MAYELDEIKKIRKGSGLTQSELAKIAGVSQSLIAKTEAGLIDPAYSKMKKIFDALDAISKEKELKAFEIMNKNIIALSPFDSIKNAIKKMKKYEISQMPVIENNKAVGFVSESIVLDSLIQQKGKIVSDIMEDSPPIFSMDASITLVSNLLRSYPIVLISEKGKLKGVITKADVLRKIYKS